MCANDFFSLFDITTNAYVNLKHLIRPRTHIKIITTTHRPRVYAMDVGLENSVAAATAMHLLTQRKISTKKIYDE